MKTLLALACGALFIAPAYSQSIRIPGTEVDDAPPARQKQAPTPASTPSQPTKTLASKKEAPAMIPKPVPDQPESNPKVEKKVTPASSKDAANALPAIPLTPFIPANP